MTRASDIAIVVCVVAWIVSFSLPVIVPGSRVDTSIPLILMAIVGGLIAVRRRREETAP